MTANALTDRSHWEDYWKRHDPPRIDERGFYAPLLRDRIGGRGHSWLRDLGVPGTFDVYALQYLSFTKAAILDEDLGDAYLELSFALNGVAWDWVEGILGDVLRSDLLRSCAGGCLSLLSTPLARCSTRCVQGPG